MLQNQPKDTYTINTPNNVVFYIFKHHIVKVEASSEHAKEDSFKIHLSNGEIITQELGLRHFEEWLNQQ